MTWGDKVRFTPETALELVQKFPLLYGIQRFIAMITGVSHWFLR
jgi:hypothetical protein